MVDISCYFYDTSQLTLHCLAEMALHLISLPRQHRSPYEIFTPALTFRGFLFWSKTLLLCPQYSVRDIYSDNMWSRFRALSRIDLSWLATSPCVSLSVSLSQVPLPVHCNQHLEVCTLGAIFKTSLTRAPPQARVRQDVDDPDYLDQVPPASPSLSPGLTASAPPLAATKRTNRLHTIAPPSTTCRRCAPHLQIY